MNPSVSGMIVATEVGIIIKNVKNLKLLKASGRIKRLHAIAQVLSIMSLALACVCPLQSVHAQSEIESEIDQADVVDIWLITDIHYMAPNLTDGGQRFDIFQKQAAGMDYEYGPDRMEDLIKRMRVFGLFPTAVLMRQR